MFLIVKTKKTYKFLMFSNDVFNHFLSIHYISSINGHAFCKKFYRIRCKKFYAYSYSYHTCKIGTFSTTFLNFALLYISLQNQAVWKNLLFQIVGPENSIQKSCRILFWFVALLVKCITFLVRFFDNAYSHIFWHIQGS